MPELSDWDIYQARERWRLALNKDSLSHDDGSCRLSFLLLTLHVISSKHNKQLNTRVSDHVPYLFQVETSVQIRNISMIKRGSWRGVSL